MSLSAEQIKKNWEIYRGLSNKLKDKRFENINKMLDHFEERIMLAPASSKIFFHNCFPGGLVKHSLFVFKQLVKLVKAFDLKYSNETIIFVSLYHDFAKTGDLEQDFYLPQDSDWHREKGQHYKINENLNFWMPNSHRSLWIFQRFGIELTEEEWLSILLNDGIGAEENRVYKFRVPELAFYLNVADMSATMEEKKEYEKSKLKK